MKQKDLTKLSDQELLDISKKSKSTNMMSALLIGLMIGIAIYSTVKHGFGFFTFFPLFFLPIAVNSSINNKAVETELKSRNLK